jgi:UDP-N-acetylmuramate--alanine ligase
MIDLSKITDVYFVGIGGIGMSAIARYFLAIGSRVYGYDRSESSLTDALSAEGCNIIYEDITEELPAVFRERPGKDNVIVIYTPAIPAGNKIISWFRENGFSLFKRSEILGKISEGKETLAVSGTHGKTTVSTMLAHLLRQSGIDCSAFLGGISKNYKSNLLIGKNSLTVMEADEFDRSFHRLNPSMAIVTSVDADHLDIYGDHQTMIEAYNEFFRKIRKGGVLILNQKIKDKIKVPEGVTGYTYGIEGDADFKAKDILRMGDSYTYNLITPQSTINNIQFQFPGIINIENAVAASAVALLCGASEKDLRSGLFNFTGVERRFDVRINRPGLTYIDDYAHHPEEIRACITSVREYFGGRKITGIFQPHLFTRTLNHAEGFAQILDMLDEVIILPIYPAREKPIEGVSSEIILEKMTIRNKRLLEKKDIPGMLDLKNIDVLLTIGAGDIDRLVDPIEEALNNRGKS